MKSVISMLSLLVTLLLSGCAHYAIPLEGKLDDSTKRRLQPLQDNTPNIGFYLEKQFAKKVITQKSSGATCGHAYSDIPIGSAMNNLLIESLRTTFPRARILESPERPIDHRLVKINVEQMDIRFEYSANGGCNTPMMDQGSISGTIATQILNRENKMIADEFYDFKESEIDDDIPPKSQTGVLDKCMNKTVYKYVRQVKGYLK